MRKPPTEVVASLLAVTTLFTPHHLPPWAIFIAWAGTFAAGGPKPAILRKIWTVMPIGAIAAYLIVLGFGAAAQVFSGTAQLAAQCVILFSINALMMSLGRLPAFAFIPGMFFGFASYFATYFGGFGLVPGDSFYALVSVVLMNALGPLYAWLTATLGAHRHAEAEEAHEPSSPATRVVA